GCGMVVGARGWPGTASFLATMLGLALACGGASALNHVLDADLDRLMGKRTELRPVAAGRVPAPRGLEFGLALSALSFVVLASAVNMLTAALALVGNPFYVLLYTAVLLGVSVVPFAWGTLGPGYLAAALVLGSAFLASALRLGSGTDRRRAGFLFHYSLLYLALLFVAMAVDALAG